MSQYKFQYPISKIMEIIQSFLNHFTLILGSFFIPNGAVFGASTKWVRENNTFL